MVRVAERLRPVDLISARERKCCGRCPEYIFGGLENWYSVSVTWVSK